MNRSYVIRVMSIIALPCMLILKEEQIMDIAWICLGIWGIDKLYAGYLILSHKKKNISNMSNIRVLKEEEYLKYQGIRNIKISIFALINTAIVISISMSPSINFLKYMVQNLLFILVILTIFITSITGAFKLRNKGIISVDKKKYK